MYFDHLLPNTTAAGFKKWDWAIPPNLLNDPLINTESRSPGHGKHSLINVRLMVQMEARQRSEFTIQHDGAVHQPLGAASYYFQHSLLNWLCSNTSNSKINIRIGAQPNTSPHIGNLTTIGVAFALAYRLQEKGKLPCIYFDVVDTAPAPERDEIIQETVYQKSLRWTGAAETFLQQFDQVLEAFSLSSGVQYVRRTQKEILSGDSASKCVREIVRRHKALEAVYSSEDSRFGLRASCPKEGCGLADKAGIHNRYYEDRIDFKCPKHGTYSLNLLSPTDTTKIELNTPLRNLLRNRISQTDYDADWIQVTGADYAGFYQEQFLWRPLTSEFSGKAPIIVYSPQILDWSGAKLSKSLYIKQGAYDYLQESQLQYMLSFDLFKASGRKLTSVYRVCLEWIDNPHLLFRSYTIYHLDGLLQPKDDQPMKPHAADFRAPKNDYLQ
jgi:hypothetical protein